MIRLSPTEKERAVAAQITQLLYGLTFDEASMALGMAGGAVGLRKQELLETAIFQAADAHTV
jgi:hypothetical protein